MSVRSDRERRDGTPAVDSIFDIMLLAGIRLQPSRDSTLCGSYGRSKQNKQNTLRGAGMPPPKRSPLDDHPLALDPPPECKAAWLKAQRAWIHLAMEPVMVKGRMHSGRSSRVLLVLQADTVS